MRHMMKGNGIYVWGSIITSVFLFLVFKIFYPYPNMVMDSYIYIKGAVLNLDANSFPIGYSKFLAVFSWFSRSAILLVWVQYCFLEFSCLLLFLTVLYFFKLSKASRVILFIFLFCNPLFFFLSNFIMSDTLFTTLSILWITQLIWIICRPQPYMIWIHASLLLLAFTIRYNALYYPMVASIALLLSRLSLRYKILAIGLQFLFIGTFVLYTRGEMQKLTGVRQFSAYGGWQIANNALYMYGHIYKEVKEAPFRFHSLDSAVRSYFDATHRVESLLEYDADEPGFYYSADNQSPLVKYMSWQYGTDTIFQNFRKWGPMGMTCSEYGSYLIRRNPLAFARYWIWPNTIRYVNPPTEVFSKYSPYFFRTDAFGQMAQQLFDIKTLTVALPLISIRTSLLSWYPLFFTLLNLFFIMAFIGFYLFGGLKRTDKSSLYVLYSIALLWICNLGFSITASCIVLRYQVFIMIVEMAFALVLTGYLSQTKAPSTVVKTRN